MSRLFESFGFLNRNSDVRLLEHQSVRSAFIWLLIDVFVLGMLIFATIYEFVRLHRFDWTIAILLPIFILSAIRILPLI
jgi:hypothetical protein